MICVKDEIPHGIGPGILQAKVIVACPVLSNVPAETEL